MPEPRRSPRLVADEMRTLAALGRRFATNPYEVERAERLMALAAEVAGLARGDAGEVRDDLLGPGRWERTTPVLTVSAAVFDGQGRVLLARRGDNGRWVLPGGFADVGPTPAVSALRELWEEAGLRGRVERLLGVFDGRVWDPGAAAHQVSLLFEVVCEDLSASPGLEMTAVGFFPPDALPEDLVPPHALRLREALELRRESPTYFDPADSRGVGMPTHQRGAERRNE